jgi:hypothetical protein
MAIKDLKRRVLTFAWVFPAVMASLVYRPMMLTLGVAVAVLAADEYHLATRPGYTGSTMCRPGCVLRGPGTPLCRHPRPHRSTDMPPFIRQTTDAYSRADNRSIPVHLAELSTSSHSRLRHSF